MRKTVLLNFNKNIHELFRYNDKLCVDYEEISEDEMNFVVDSIGEDWLK